MAEPADDRASRQPIEDERLRRLVDVVVDALHPEEIRLFGSRARGDADEDSDYDLFVVVPDARSPEDISLTNTHRLSRVARVPSDIFAVGGTSSMTSAI